jgi:pimeloyl-ACP methyl ester carboxylesterase
VLPNVSREARSRRRLFAVDLLGFGRSPKPADSLYTLREHVEMIERSVIQRHGVKSLHIVAHSLGSILALALAVKYPAAVKSITLVAPVNEVQLLSDFNLLYPPVTMKTKNNAVSALLPGASRGGRDAVRAPRRGAAPGVADHRVRRVRRVLVRAPQPHRQHRALQAPPALGARLPRIHALQVSQ